MKILLSDDDCAV